MPEKKEKKEFQVDEWNAVQSSTIEAVRFNIGDLLDVRFKGAKEGKFYRYWPVPQKKWLDFMNAKSPGKFQSSSIGPLYNCDLLDAEGTVLRRVKQVTRHEKTETDADEKAVG